MVTVPTRVAPRPRWSPHLRGHLLLFDRRSEPASVADAGARLLLTASLLEIVRLTAMRWLSPTLPLVLLLPALLGVALLIVPIVSGVRLSRLGFRRWRDWTTTERSYFLQVIVIANVVFPVVLAGPLANRTPPPGTVSSLWSVFVPYLCYGFYQEVVYRGLVQRDLVRRWGAPIGVVVANVLYTFGPLHWNYFLSPAALGLPMFAAIFGIGLFFGVVYERSSNLWIVAVFHAIGNAYIVWSVGPIH